MIFRVFEGKSWCEWIQTWHLGDEVIHAAYVQRAHTHTVVNAGQMYGRVERMNSAISNNMCYYYYCYYYRLKKVCRVKYNGRMLFSTCTICWRRLEEGGWRERVHALTHMCDCRMRTEGRQNERRKINENIRAKVWTFPVASSSSSFTSACPYVEFGIKCSRICLCVYAAMFVIFFFFRLLSVFSFAIFLAALVCSGLLHVHYFIISAFNRTHINYNKYSISFRCAQLVCVYVWQQQPRQHRRSAHNPPTQYQ